MGGTDIGLYPDGKYRKTTQEFEMGAGGGGAYCQQGDIKYTGDFSGSGMRMLPHFPSCSIQISTRVKVGYNVRKLLRNTRVK